MRMTKKYTTTLLLLFMLSVTFAFTTSAAPRFSKTNIISMKKGKTRKGSLKSLKKAQKKKKWKFASSDKTVATVKRSGKYGYKVTAKKKDGYAVIKASQGTSVAYLLVKVGKGSTNQNSKTQEWAKAGGLVLPSDKPNPSQGGSSGGSTGGNAGGNAEGNAGGTAGGSTGSNTGGNTGGSTGETNPTIEYFLEDIPDTITLPYNADNYYFGEYYYTVNGTKCMGGSASATSSGTGLSAGTTTRNGKQCFYISPSTVTFPNTLNLPKTYTVTAKYATITKTINVTITDWGTPDRELYNRWYSDLLANSGANAINASNVVDWYRQNDPGNNGVDWYGNKYQWSVELAKAGAVCDYIAKHYPYDWEDHNNYTDGSTINDYMAQKHGKRVGGTCGPANSDFCRFCTEALGLQATTYGGSSHVVSRITYNGQTYDMDATPQANVQNGNGSTLNASAAPKTLGAAAPEALDAPEADEVIEDITDLVLAAEEVPEAVDEANILEAPDVSEEEYTDDVLEASEEEYTDDVLEAPEDFLSDGDFYEEDDFELMEEGF